MLRCDISLSDLCFWQLGRYNRISSCNYKDLKADTFLLKYFSKPQEYSSNRSVLRCWKDYRAGYYYCCSAPQILALMILDALHPVLVDYPSLGAVAAILLMGDPLLGFLC